MIEVPICKAHEEYATGLSLTEHGIITANARRAAQDKNKLGMALLMQTKATLMRDATALLNNPKVTTVQRQFARWDESNRLRAKRSTIETFPADDTDYLAPVSAKQPTQPIDSQIGPEPRPTRPDEPECARDDTNDLEDLRRRKNWR